jgi:hypothetical protein
MTVTFTLNSAFLDTEAGPFNISGTTDSNVTTELVANLLKTDLEGNGHTIFGIDDNTTGFTIQSVGICVNSIVKPVSQIIPYVSCSEGMDVVFLVDYTGSMGPAIEGVKTSIANIASTIVTESNSNYRLGLVIFDEYTSGTNSNYDDKTDYTSLPSSQRYINTGLNGYYQWITSVEMMSTNNETSFTTQLNKLNTINFPLGSGENAPEPSDMGVDLVGLQSFAGSFRTNVARIVILITDATPGGNDDTYNSTDINFVNGLIPQLVNQGVRVLLMTTAGTNVLYDLATGTNGVVSAGFTGSDIITAIEDVCVPLPTPTPTPTATAGGANNEYVAFGSNRTIACAVETNPSIDVYFTASDWDSIQLSDVLYTTNDLSTPVSNGYYYNASASSGREVVRMLDGTVTIISDCNGSIL